MPATTKNTVEKHCRCTIHSLNHLDGLHLAAAALRRGTHAAMSVSVGGKLPIYSGVNSPTSCVNCSPSCAAVNRVGAGARSGACPYSQRTLSGRAANTLTGIGGHGGWADFQPLLHRRSTGRCDGKNRTLYITRCSPVRFGGRQCQSRQSNTHTEPAGATTWQASPRFLAAAPSSQ